jgi:hypothetical protein
MGEQTLANRRRSARYSICIPLVISGRDANGNEFKENARTSVVNQHGGKVLTAHQLAVGAEVVIENPALGTVAKATVAWVGPEPNPGDLYQVGVQLFEAQNIWGIEFPPEDWGPEKELSEAQAAKVPLAAAPSPAPSAPTSSLPSAPPPKEAVTAVEEITAQLVRRLEESADSQARGFQERLAQLTQQIGSQLEIDLREHAASAREQQMAAIDRQVQAANEQLSAAKAEMERLEAKLQDSQRSVQAALASVPPPLGPGQMEEKIRAELLPVLRQMTESGVSAASEHFHARVQAEADQALTTWDSSLRAAADSSLEQARQRIAATVKSVVDSLNRETEAGFQEMRRCIQKELQENTEKGLLGIRAQLDETLQKHREASLTRLQETARETGERQANLLQTQLDALLASRLDQAQRGSQALGENLAHSLEEAARTTGEKSSKEWQARLQETCDHIVASSSDRVQGQINEALTLLTPKLKEMQDRAANDAAEALRAKIAEILSLLQSGAKK